MCSWYKLAGSLVFPLCLWGADGCVVVNREKISFGDLKGKVPLATSILSASIFGFSPAPGQTRVIRGGEIRAFLAKHQLRPTDEIEPICVRRAANVPAEEDVVAAIRSAFRPTEVQVEIVQFSRMPLPVGRIHFDVAQFPAAPSASDSVLWRGFHKDEEGRTRAFWAQVRVLTKVCRLVAATDLIAGRVLAAENATTTEAWAFPDVRESGTCDLDKVVGFILKRAVAAGSVIRSQDLVAPSAVEKGKGITVLVDTGKAQLSLTGQAEATGRVGDRIAFTTALSKRRYVGVAVGKGVVRVTTFHD